MKKMIKTPLVLAMGTGLVSLLSITPAQAASFDADSNLFEITELSNAYMTTANQGDTEGKCGEAKCGEGKCGNNNRPRGN